MNRRNFLASGVALAVAPLLPAVKPPLWGVSTLARTMVEQDAVSAEVVRTMRSLAQRASGNVAKPIIRGGQAYYEMLIPNGEQ